MRLPPGNRGLPWLGESMALLRNPFGFLEERRDRFGNVFRSKVLGREVAFLAGLEGAERFYDETIISRSDAHPYQLVDLFGGDNMEMFDGERHLAMKRVALTAFDETAIAAKATIRPLDIASEKERYGATTPGGVGVSAPA